MYVLILLIKKNSIFNSGKKSPITTRNWMQNSKSQNELDIDEGLYILELNIYIYFFFYRRCRRITC